MQPPNNPYRPPSPYGQQSPYPPRSPQPGPSFTPPPQQPFMQPPYGAPPPRYMPPLKPRRPFYRNPLVIIIALFFLIVIIYGVIQDSRQKPTTTATATAQLTQAATSAPRPTPTPAPTSTPAQKVQQLAQHGAAAKAVTSTYEGGVATIAVTLYLAGSNEDYQAEIKLKCRNINMELWRGGIDGLAMVHVDFKGPATDGGEADMGACEVSQATAAQIDWGNVTPDAAWEIYDLKYFSLAISG